ncbi:hypothetical protein RB195_004811 [Necator americanus]|uniref:Uncharacterized protein n=1 Tax=Necator americanus TaxID=51031 RepID=A0ABR1BN39_NECAM
MKTAKSFNDARIFKKNKIKSSISYLLIYTQQYSFAGTLSDKCVLSAAPHLVEQHVSEDGEKAETSGK